MRHAHFLVLTGRLNEFPLHELIETLRGQHKTGRLLVEFKAGPCALYFREGALVEATMGSLRGLEALSLALSLQDDDAAPFNFNPLVAPPDAPGTQGREDGAAAFARESAAQSRAQVIEVEPEEARPSPLSSSGEHPAATRPDASARAAQLEAPAEALRPRALLPAAEEGALVERLARIETAVSTQARRANVERAVYAVLVIVVVLVALLWRGREGAGGNALTGILSQPPAGVAADADLSTGRPAEGRTTVGAAPAPESAAGAPRASSQGSAAVAGATAETAETPAARPTAKPADARTRQPSSSNSATAAGVATTAAKAPGNSAQPTAAARPGREGGHVVQVRMTIVRGRVLRAEVSNPRPGMAAYEALALRMARQRRYPEEFTGQETLRLPVRR